MYPNVQDHLSLIINQDFQESNNKNQQIII